MKDELNSKKHENKKIVQELIEKTDKLKNYYEIQQNLEEKISENHVIKEKCKFLEMQNDEFPQTIFENKEAKTNSAKLL